MPIVNQVTGDYPMLEIPHKRVSVAILKDILMMLTIEHDQRVATELKPIGQKFQKTYSVGFTPIAVEKGLTSHMVQVPWYRRIRGDKIYINTAYFNRWAESSWRKQSKAVREKKFTDLTGVSLCHINHTLK